MQCFFCPTVVRNNLLSHSLMVMVCVDSKKPAALSKPHIDMTLKPSRRVCWLLFLFLEPNW